MLMFASALCLIMAQIQFSLIKKNKDWTIRTFSSPPSPQHPTTYHFCLSTPLPNHPQLPQSRCHMWITPKLIIIFEFCFSCLQSYAIKLMYIHIYIKIKYLFKYLQLFPCIFAEYQTGAIADHCFEGIT